MSGIPALGGTLMVRHDEVEAADNARPFSTLNLITAVTALLLTEKALVAVTGWSFDRVGAVGCQLWGELVGDDRFTGEAIA